MKSQPILNGRIDQSQRFLRNRLTWLIILLMWSLTSNSFSQGNDIPVNDPEKSEYFKMPVNISFSPGFSLGESLAKGKKIENNLSLNIIAGKAARLRGIEFGSIWNLYTEDIIGLQFSGIANTVRGSGEAGQFAGIANLNAKNFTGAQFAGIGNFVGGEYQGAQFAGIVNLNAKSFTGAQFAGIANIIGGEYQGAQFAGIANIAKDAKGLQVAGIINIAKKFETGVQIGIINISEENEGIPIGLVSYVRKVGFHYDVWGDESRFFNVGLRSGTERFHNILFVGVQANDPIRYTFGIAMGLHLKISKPSYLDIDLSYQQIQEEDWTNDLNTLNKLRILYGRRVSNYMSIYAGPTLNYFISEIQDGSDIAPWTFSDSRSGKHWNRFWPGFVVGVRF